MKTIVRGQDVEDRLVDEHQVVPGHRYYYFRVKQVLRGKDLLWEAEQETTRDKRVRVLSSSPTHITVDEENGAASLLYRDGFDRHGQPLWRFADGMPVALSGIFPPRPSIAARL